MCFAASFVWTISVLALTYLAIRFLYLPSTGDSPRTEAQPDLGPLRREEKITAAVLSCALIFWTTEYLHGIHSTTIGMAGLLILLGCNVFDRFDFRSAMGWDNLIFIGGIINLGAAIPALKIDVWLGQTAGPVITPMIANFYVFVIVLCVTIYLTRFVLVSFTATTAIFTVVLIPFALQAGINPWITSFIVYVSTNIWLAFYQNSTFITSFYAVDGAMVTHRQMRPLAVAYCAISMTALLLSIPLWRYLGLLP